MTARQLALHAFWSDHPLCALYALANGGWQGGVWRPANSWSLKSLIRFSESLPTEVIRRLNGDEDAPEGTESQA